MGNPEPSKAAAAPPPAVPGWEPVEAPPAAQVCVGTHSKPSPPEPVADPPAAADAQPFNDITPLTADSAAAAAGEPVAEVSTADTPPVDTPFKEEPAAQVPLELVGGLDDCLPSSWMFQHFE